jgi:transposase
MGRPRREELRALKPEERRELERVVKASSERVDSMKRAKALLAVTAGKNLTSAAQEAGLSREGVGQVVKRFNQRGLEVLSIASGRGRKPTYSRQQQGLILEQVLQQPDRQEDQTATWSLMTLRRALRKSGLPHISAETIRLGLHEAGYSYQQSRTWCRTGYALRKRKAGTVTVYDEQTPEKND